MGFSACSTGGGVNIFSIEDDRALGLQIAAQIESDPVQFPLLDSADYPKVYAKIYAIRDSILATGKVVHGADFSWPVRVVNIDTVVNAFCTPGGHIYVYTGLLRYLDNEAELAGIMGHEMAHADLRHSTDQLTKAYGINFLLNLIVGEDGNAIAEIVSGLGQLAFSRGDESQADKYAVDYLCGTSYATNAMTGFFEKIETEENVSNMPAFFSTHPSSSDRAEQIKKQSAQLGCNGEATYADEYKKWLRYLPAETK